MKKAILLLAIIATCNVACRDWLDVAPEMQQKESDLFGSYRGFRDALTGCYMSMADRAIYGERLTITNIESLANLWYLPDNSTREEDGYLTRHDYQKDAPGARALAVIYGKLFNTIAQANVILKNIRLTGDVIPDPATRAVIEGEAYAIRAYCQFDALRLFGQLPRGATRIVELPYSETASLDDMPAYYGFDAYVTRLKSDVEKALALLEENDPLFQYSFGQLNGPVLDDTYLLFRQSRLNYYAVKALQARLYLYLGERENAHAVAMELIAPAGGGDPVSRMSGLDDLTPASSGVDPFPALPSECLFYLSKYNVKDYTTAYLIGGEGSLFNNTRLGLTPLMRAELYAGQDVSAHNRYHNLWAEVYTAASAPHYATKKYWYKDDASSLMLKRQIIPMLRVSEVYLIAIETSTDLDEVNALYKEYMTAHNVMLTTGYFTSLAAVQAEILAEYRREFFAEGQMFYAYKRVGAANMLWRAAAVEEGEYVLPLPETEFNPNTLNQ
ncbi:MAG: RagB/SusD family nutrient uptake outer membrane protein [Odoribacteraceae bacterium]|jgi:hypothetical protein|nr:RagB/SusD family nutrient uptake outer membrane protein [Odoribacteraceae bacterium]